MAAVVVIGGGGAGVAVALSSSHHHSTTSTTSLTPASTTVSQTTPSPTTASPSTASPVTTPGGSGLSANVPFSSCTELTPAERGVPGATDEVACAGSDVSSEGAVAVFYATLPSPSAAAQYVASLDESAGSPSGACSGIQLGVGTAFCNFTDSSPESGIAVMFVGEGFTFGPTATSQANCAAFKQSSTSGAAVLVWNYTGSNVVGGALSCVASTTPLATMRQGLYDGDFELDDQ